MKPHEIEIQMAKDILEDAQKNHTILWPYLEEWLYQWYLIVMLSKTHYPLKGFVEPEVPIEIYDLHKALTKKHYLEEIRSVTSVWLRIAQRIAHHREYQFWENDEAFLRKELSNGIWTWDILG